MRLLSILSLTIKAVKNAANIAKVNSQNEVTYFEVFDLPETLQVFCLLSLTRLSLQGNVPSGSEWHIPSEVGQMTELRHLSVRNIGGDQLPETLGQLKSLVHLSLYGNELKELPRSLSGLSNLFSLHVSAPLKEIPSFLSALPLGQLVFYEHAQFSSIPEGFFKNLNPALRDLRISIANSQALNSFSDLTNLRSLTIFVSDELTQFPWSLTHMTSSNSLNFDGNYRCKFASLPQNFSKTFESLAFKSCAFTEISVQIALNKNLWYLQMSQHHIVDMAAICLTRAPLRYISLPYNSLEIIPSEISYLSETLESLNLYGNRLITVPADELIKMKKLRFLSLQNNRIPADEIQRLRRIFSAKPSITVTF